MHKLDWSDNVVNKHCLRFIELFRILKRDSYSKCDFPSLFKQVLQKWQKQTNSSPWRITGPARKAEARFIRRSSHERSSCRTPAPPAWTTGWSLYWRCPRSRCHGWCSWKHKNSVIFRDAQIPYLVAVRWAQERSGTRTCPLRCRDRPWWFRVWSRRDWSLRAWPFRFSQHSGPPTPKTTASVRINVASVRSVNEWRSRTHHGQNRARAHVLDESGVEGPVLQVDVMLLQQVLWRLWTRTIRTIRTPLTSAPVLF